MVFGFAGSQTRGQLDLATRYNPLAWPGVQARETLAMFRYDATSVLSTLTCAPVSKRNDPLVLRNVWSVPV